ncbi:ImmA/IrrE family metallo-endopeptidase [Acetobacteraceae bacterium ESL0709]|nr:ImmA/IrrE family metallo-endopeptidase [Acetobacteraceae bacterium ESL0697]MDF7677442.1 ImmA/IrrE family metallo-endopeptidase [Acetobacteraceae bacterium ESL0709]
MTDHKPDYPKVMKEVQRLLEQFGCKEPPVDPLKIAKALDINVKFVTFGTKSKNVSGFYDPSENAIYVNADDPSKRQTFTIAHELGHACLHKDWARTEDYRVLLRYTESENSDFREKEANAFAAHLLVPRFMLIKYVDKVRIPDLADMFAVSKDVIGYRIGYEFRDAGYSV